MVARSARLCVRGARVSAVACEIADFVELVHRLDDVTQHDQGAMVGLDVGGKTFGYLWPRTRTVGLEQTISEQLALVAERPDVFEIQYTASASAGWWSASTASRGTSSPS